MNIVIDARTLGSKPSGIGIYAFNYIKELIKSSHHIILLTDVAESEELSFLKEQGTEIIQYGVSTYRSAQVLKYFAFVREQLVKIQPELFWEPNVLIPRKLSGYKGKVMITIHDMFPVTHMQYFGWKYGLYFRFMLAKTIRNIDMILYDSKETKRETEQFYPSAAKKKSRIQYVIVPRTAAEQAQAEESVIAKEILNREYFLYVGNMEKRKGVDLLLDAYEKYRKNGGRRALILAGKSREADIDNKIAQMTKAYDDVTYYGYVSDADKQTLYQKCACFIFPSRAEGFGICVLEAMNYYKPVITSDLSIFKEIAGECAQYFPLEGNRGTQIEHLSRKMTDFCIDIDKKAYDEVMERYTPECLGKEMVEVLNNV